MENISLLQVNRILSENGGVKAVETNLGTVECQYFVNGSGTPLAGVYNMGCGGGGWYKSIGEKIKLKNYSKNVLMVGGVEVD